MKVKGGLFEGEKETNGTDGMKRRYYDQITLPTCKKMSQQNPLFCTTDIFLKNLQNFKVIVEHYHTLK